MLTYSSNPNLTQSTNTNKELVDMQLQTKLLIVSRMSKVDYRNSVTCPNGLQQLVA